MHSGNLYSTLHTSPHLNPGMSGSTAHTHLRLDRILYKGNTCSRAHTNTQRTRLETFST